MRRRVLLVALLALAAPHLAACDDKESAKLPPPQEASGDSVAEFCGMTLAEHPGPKGQIFVRPDPTPFWFASVHDTFAFLMLPDTPKAVVAVYVSDMAKARNWDQPEPGTWVEAHKAVYVIGSRKRGGMDEAEAVPFSDPEAAKRFAAEYGGRVVGFDEMPRDYILSSGTAPSLAQQPQQPIGGSHDGHGQ